MNRPGETGNGRPPPDMRACTGFFLNHTDPSRLHAESLRAGDAKYCTELSRLLSEWQCFQSTGRGGSFVDICVPQDEAGEAVPTAIKVVNTFGSRFDGMAKRVGKLVAPEEVLSASGRVYVPEGVQIPDQARQAAGLLALEHDMYERLYPMYVIPAEFIAFTPQVDVIEEKPLVVSAGEKRAREEAGAIMPDGRRYLLQKGVPALAMVEDYYDDLRTLDGKEPLEDPFREQLKHFIRNLEEVYHHLGFYPDPGLINPQSGNLVIANAAQLVLIDSNFLISAREDFAKEDFNNILDALYYFAR